MCTSETLCCFTFQLHFLLLVPNSHDGSGIKQTAVRVELWRVSPKGKTNSEGVSSKVGSVRRSSSEIRINTSSLCRYADCKNSELKEDKCRKCFLCLPKPKNKSVSGCHNQAEVEALKTAVLKVSTGGWLQEWVDPHSPWYKHRWQRPLSLTAALGWNYVHILWWENITVWVKMTFFRVMGINYDIKMVILRVFL